MNAVNSVIYTLNENINNKRDLTNTTFNQLEFNDLGEQEPPLSLTWNTIDSPGIQLSNGQTIATSADLEVFRELSNVTFTNEIIINNLYETQQGKIGFDLQSGEFSLSLQTETDYNELKFANGSAVLNCGLYIGGLGNTSAQIALSGDSDGEILRIVGNLQGYANVEAKGFFMRLPDSKNLNIVPLNDYRPRILDNENYELGKIAYIGDAFLYSNNSYDATTWLTSALEVETEINLYKIIQINPAANAETFIINTTLFEEVKKIRLFNISANNHKAIISIYGDTFDLTHNEGLTIIFTPGPNDYKKYDFIS